MPTPPQNFMDDPSSAPVEKTAGKIDAVEQPREPLVSFRTTLDQEIPLNIIVPQDLIQTLQALRFYDSQTVQNDPDYINAAGQLKTDVEQQFQLLIRCHATLRLRESSLFQAAFLLHKLLQKVQIHGNRELPRLLCALLFVCQKYEPTDRSIYSVTQITTKLFGANNAVNPLHILDLELELLDLLDYKLECTTPYSLVHVYGQAAAFDAKAMNLVLYLTTLAAVAPVCQNFHPTDVAAATILLVLEHNQRPWTPSLVFWTAKKPYDLFIERKVVLQLWQAAFNDYKQGRPGVVFQKYVEARKFQVALEQPLFN